MTFLNELSSAMNKTTTENGAETFISTQNPLVDLFALAGATRKNPQLGLELFQKAFIFDRQKAVKILFYLRDIRGGQGERQLFRNCLKWVAESYPKISKQLVQYVPEYGRFDDLFVLDIEAFIDLVKEQLEQDKMAEAPSLLAKWLPSENASSVKSKQFARAFQKLLSLNSKDYRKMLSGLRAKIKLVEQQMSKKEWSVIDYSKVPSQAQLKYTKAFLRNDEARRRQYLEAVTKGDQKINTGTLYPYQLYNRARETGVNEMWNNLPDYTQGKNAVVVADVSGSMSGDPMSVSVSLAIYFAERNKGQFKDHFITFSSNPQLQKIAGKTLQEKIMFLEKADWEQTTDLQAVFEVILNTAKANNTPVEEMPETIYIISDMEFNSCVRGDTNFKNIEQKYKEAEYKLPNLVFWNVDARNKQVPVEQNQSGVTLVSGLSPSTFRLAVENKSPIELVEDVINSPRYTNITIVI